MEKSETDALSSLNSKMEFEQSNQEYTPENDDGFDSDEFGDEFGDDEFDFEEFELEEPDDLDLIMKVEVEVKRDRKFRSEDFRVAARRQLYQNYPDIGARWREQLLDRWVSVLQEAETHPRPVDESTLPSLPKRWSSTGGCVSLTTHWLMPVANQLETPTPRRPGTELERALGVSKRVSEETAIKQTHTLMTAFQHPSHVSVIPDTLKIRLKLLMRMTLDHRLAKLIELGVTIDRNDAKSEAKVGKALLQTKGKKFRFSHSRFELNSTVGAVMFYDLHRNFMITSDDGSRLSRAMLLEHRFFGQQYLSTNVYPAQYQDRPDAVNYVIGTNRREFVSGDDLDVVGFLKLPLGMSPGVALAQYRMGHLELQMWDGTFSPEWKHGLYYLRLDRRDMEGSLRAQLPTALQIATQIEIEALQRVRNLTELIRVFEPYGYHRLEDLPSSVVNLLLEQLNQNVELRREARARRDAARSEHASDDLELERMEELAYWTDDRLAPLQARLDAAEVAGTEAEVFQSSYYLDMARTDQITQQYLGRFSAHLAQVGVSGEAPGRMPRLGARPKVPTGVTAPNVNHWHRHQQWILDHDGEIWIWSHELAQYITRDQWRHDAEVRARDLAAAHRKWHSFWPAHAQAEFEQELNQLMRTPRELYLDALSRRTLEEAQAQEGERRTMEVPKSLHNQFSRALWNLDLNEIAPDETVAAINPQAKFYRDGLHRLALQRGNQMVQIRTGEPLCCIHIAHALNHGLKHSLQEYGELHRESIDCRLCGFFMTDLDFDAFEGYQQQRPMTSGEELREFQQKIGAVVDPNQDAVQKLEETLLSHDPRIMETKWPATPRLSTGLRVLVFWAWRQFPHQMSELKWTMEQLQRLVTDRKQFPIRFETDLNHLDADRAIEELKLAVGSKLQVIVTKISKTESGRTRLVAFYRKTVWELRLQLMRWFCISHLLSLGTPTDAEIEEGWSKYSTLLDYSQAVSEQIIPEGLPNSVSLSIKGMKPIVMELDLGMARAIDVKVTRLPPYRMFELTNEMIHRVMQERRATRALAAPTQTDGVAPIRPIKIGGGHHLYGEPHSIAQRWVMKLDQLLDTVLELLSQDPEFYGKFVVRFGSDEALPSRGTVLTYLVAMLLGGWDFRRDGPVVRGKYGTEGGFYRHYWLKPQPHTPSEVQREFLSWTERHPELVEARAALSALYLQMQQGMVCRIPAYPLEIEQRREVRGNVYAEVKHRVEILVGPEAATSIRKPKVLSVLEAPTIEISESRGRMESAIWELVRRDLPEINGLKDLEQLLHQPKRYTDVVQMYEHEFNMLYFDAFQGLSPHELQAGLAAHTYPDSVGMSGQTAEDFQLVLTDHHLDDEDSPAVELMSEQVAAEQGADYRQFILGLLGSWFALVSRVQHAPKEVAFAEFNLKLLKDYQPQVPAQQWKLLSKDQAYDLLLHSLYEINLRNTDPKLAKSAKWLVTQFFLDLHELIRLETNSQELEQQSWKRNSARARRSRKEAVLKEDPVIKRFIAQFGKQAAIEAGLLKIDEIDFEDDGLFPGESEEPEGEREVGEGQVQAYGAMDEENENPDQFGDDAAYAD